MKFEDFSKRVKLSPCGCSIWTGARGTDGYGRLRFDGKPMSAHRAVFSAFNGPIPHGLLVRHTCDTPLCVNPSHLILGTDADNAADRQARGRTRVGVGERQHLAKLTEAKVKAIRLDIADGVKQKDIARRFGVTQGAISALARGITWKHVA